MVGIDPTKFALTLILVGFILAVAVFQSRVLEPAESQPVTCPPMPGVSTQGKKGGQDGAPMPEKLRAEGAAAVSALEACQTELQACQKSIEEQQERLAAEWETIREEKEENASQKRQIEQAKITLKAWEEDLLDRERKAERLSRWSLLALGLACLIGIASPLLATVLSSRRRAR